MKGILLVLFSVNFVTFAKELISTKIGVPDSLKTRLNFPEDYFSTFEDIGKKYGYNVSTYNVTTEDGYILKQFRVNSPKCATLKPTPMLLMHGLLLSSDIFIASANNSLTRLLADSCYDVWLGNNRGNYYGRNHVSLNPDTDIKFWDFSLDEIGYYDGPAIIDLILEKTGAKHVNFIGYSQGCTVIAITQVVREGYSNKVNLNINLGPAVRPINIKSVTFKLLCNLVGALYKPLTNIGWVELFPKDGFVSTVAQLLFHNLKFTRPVVKIIFTLFDHYNEGSVNDDAVIGYSRSIPAGVSAKLVNHYYQILSSKNFSKFDYGAEENKVKYGTEIAPVYDLSKASAKALFIIGKEDHVTVEEDVLWYANQLPNVVKLFYVDDPDWCHIDMSLSKNVPNLMYPEILYHMEKYV